MENKKLNLVIISLFVLLASCSADYHLKKALAKDPSLLKTKEIIVNEVHHISDTILIAGGIDTIIKLDSFKVETERTIVERKGIITKVIEKPYTIIETDTVYLTDTIQVPQYQQVTRKGITWLELLFYLGLFLIVIILFKSLRNGNP